MNELAAKLGPLVLEDLDRGPTPLASLWRERPVLLVFVRHFG